MTEMFTTISGRSMASPIEALNDDLSTLVARHYQKFIEDLEQTTGPIDWDIKRLEAKHLRSITNAEIEHYFDVALLKAPQGQNRHERRQIPLSIKRTRQRVLRAVQKVFVDIDAKIVELQRAPSEANVSAAFENMIYEFDV